MGEKGKRFEGGEVNIPDLLNDRVGLIAQYVRVYGIQPPKTASVEGLGLAVLDSSGHLREPIKPISDNLMLLREKGW